MADEFRLYFSNEIDAEEARRTLAALTVGGRPVMHAHRNGPEVFAGCSISVIPEPGEFVCSSLNNRCERFSQLFYQAGGAKSGCHHPRGIFWIRMPSGCHVRQEEKLPLVEAAHMSAEIAGLRFNNDCERNADSSIFRVAS